MSKVSKIAGSIVQLTEGLTKKNSAMPLKPLTEYEKFYESQKLLSEAAASQGKAILAMSKADSVKQVEMVQQMKSKNAENRLACAREVVEVIPMPKEIKLNALGNINAKIENRHLVKELSNKSAKASADTILEIRPYDLSGKKQELMERYGNQLQENQAQRKIKNIEAQKQKITENAIKALRQDFLQDTRDFTSILKQIRHKMPEDSLQKYINVDGYNEYWQALNELRVKSKNLSEFAYNAGGYLGKVFTDEGLIFAKDVLENISDEMFDPRIKAHFLSAINGELENRVLTKNLSGRTTQDIQEAFKDLSGELSEKSKSNLIEGKLAEYKAELYEKHGEQFENRSARESAKKIMEQSPYDLGAKKIELRKKFGNQTIIKSFMLEKNVGYNEAKKIAQEEMEKHAKIFGISIEEAEAKMEKRAKVIVDLYAKIGQKV